MRRKLLLICYMGAVTAGGFAFIKPSPRDTAEQTLAATPSQAHASAIAHDEVSIEIRSSSSSTHEDLEPHDPPRTPTDEQILALLEAHPELRDSLDEILSEPDPVVRREIALLILELAARSDALAER